LAASERTARSIDADSVDGEAEGALGGSPAKQYMGTTPRISASTSTLATGRRHGRTKYFTIAPSLRIRISTRTLVDTTAVSVAGGV
jgi:hypothetical protein